ncbi:MAG: glycosyltransferase family 4 protein [Acidobacteriota bacterium]
MRVLLVSKFLDGRGGDAISVRLLHGWLRDRGHDLFALGTRTPFGNGWGAELPDSDLFPSPLPSTGSGLRRLAALYRPAAARALEHLIERRRPQIAHLHNIHYHLSGSVIAMARARGLPVVWTLHDVNLFCPNINGSRDGRPCLECHVGRFHRCVAFNCRGSLAASLGAAAEAYLLRTLGLLDEVDGFLCPGHFTRTLLEAHGIPAERIHVVEPAIDLETFAAAPGGGSGFLYAGRLAAEKGIDRLIRAVGRLSATKLLIAGEGPQRDALGRLAETEAPGRVQFLGRLDRSDLARALSACDALVLPSVCLEIAPLALLEAAAAARPVVASQVGGIPEWVEDGRTGLLAPPGDEEALVEALDSIAASPTRARALGEEARRIAVRRFGAARHCGSLEEVYAGAIAR